MATKSFLKTIEIKDQSLGSKFAEALQKSDEIKTKEVHLRSKTHPLLFFVSIKQRC